MDDDKRQNLRERMIKNAKAAMQGNRLNRAQTLANEHWAYIKNLFDLYRIEDQEQIIEFHYKTAMIHGYKHGKADCERADKS